MSDETGFIVESWDDRPVLHAENIGIGVCDGGTLIGINLKSMNGETFAHAHMDQQIATEFHKRFGEILATIGANKVGKSN